MGNKKVVKKTNISNTHVPDKVYAYMIQSHHMLYELLNCEKGDSVSVEVFDDVGVEHPDGSRDAIQLKSALSNRNPVSNKAIDLWKTMYNWMLSAEIGELDPENTKYILFINVNKKGTIVDKFHSVKSTEEAIDAWNKTKEIFYDEEGKLKEIGEECRKYVEYFYKDEKKDLALKIIEKFKYKKCIEDYTITVRNEFNKSGIPEDIIDPIYVGIIGWIDIKVTKMVEAGQPIAISLEDYQKQLRALYREYNQKHSLMTYSVEPSNQEIEQEFQKKRVYIEQLDIIDCDYTEKVEAINDYLRAAIDRATWAENGDISMQSIQTKEFYNIQNPALSAYLLSRFSLGYMEENQDMAPMPLLFIVLPMMYKKEIVDFIASTQKKSGLRFFADKFTEKKNSNKDLILQIQNTSQRYKVMTLEAIGIGMSGKLFEIQKDAYVLPLEDNISSFKTKSKELEKMGKAAEKLGIWCSRLTLMEISQILKVRF